MMYGDVSFDALLEASQINGKNLCRNKFVYEMFFVIPCFKNALYTLHLMNFVLFVFIFRIYSGYIQYYPLQ